jgi:putative DNA methylase
MEAVSRSAEPPDRAMQEARRLISSQYNPPPKILDMFGGGGTIPYEAIQLGAETYSADSNALSVFIQKCFMVYSQKAEQKNIASLVERSGTNVLRQLTRETSPLYPLRNTSALSESGAAPNAYLWTYSFQCSNCGYRFFLSKRPWLSKKKGKNIRLHISDRGDRQVFSIENDSEFPDNTVWNGKSRGVKCPKCGYITDNIGIHMCQDELAAMIGSGTGTGKEFIPPLSKAMPSADFIRETENDLLAELGIELPASELPKWSGIVNPALYGIKTHGDFFNPRQRLVLLFLIRALRDEYTRLLSSESQDTANYVIALLSGLTDQIIDWNCRLSMWIPQNEQVGRAFCGPGVSMLWDYAETDPVLNGPGNLWKKLKRIVDGSRSIKPFPGNAHIFHANAQELPFEDDFFDAIVTDPPYYDNIYYSVLADFFFAWKRLLLRQIEPALFDRSTTENGKELVASKFRSQTAKNAHEDYCTELGRAIRQAERVLKKDGVFCFIYSHSSLNAWEALIRAYRPASLMITGVQPLSIERKQRPRAMTSDAVNTCIVFVSHKGGRKKNISSDELKNKTENICSGDFVSDLQKAGWHKKDIAIAVYAHGAAMIANAKSVDGCSGDLDALIAVERVVKEKFPEFRIVKRKSL